MVRSSGSKSAAAGASGPARWGLGFMTARVYHLCSFKKAIREGIELVRGAGRRNGARRADWSVSGRRFRRPSRAASARRPNLARISGALRRGCGRGPIVVVVERVPQALQDVFERLRADGIGAFPISDVEEAVSRFEAGSMILLVGDGVVPPADLVTDIADEAEPAVATVPDDEAHEQFERIDAESRWAGVALVDVRLLGSTAAMLGDWDLQSTLLRRTIQDGARRVPVEIGVAPAARRPGRAIAELRTDIDRLLSRLATRLGRALPAAAGGGVGDEAAPRNRGPAGVAAVDRAAADAGGRAVFHAGMARRGSCAPHRSRPRSTSSPGASPRCGCGRCRRGCWFVGRSGQPRESPCWRSAGGKRCAARAGDRRCA